MLKGTEPESQYDTVNNRDDIISCRRVPVNIVLDVVRTTVYHYLYPMQLIGTYSGSDPEKIVPDLKGSGPATLHACTVISFLASSRTNTKEIPVFYPDPLVRGMDPDPDPSIIKQKPYEKPKFLLFCDFFMTF